MRAERGPGAAALALLLAGCAGPAPGEAHLAVGSLDAFAADVEPLLEHRCASGGCHARAERPFRLYAPGGLRRDPRRLWLDEPLDPAEIEANAFAVAGFALEPRVEDALVLRKPLAQRAGGCWHGGGDVFLDRSDPAHRAIADWLASAPGTDGGVR